MLRISFWYKWTVLTSEETIIKFRGKIFYIFNRNKGVVFRLLCHASRIGGVIGKSGAIIKNLQQVTGAKILTSDRVVEVIAPSALSGKVVLKNPNLS